MSRDNLIVYVVHTMEITSFGGKYFKIKTKLTTAALGDKLLLTRSDDTALEITGPGEYEVGGISVVKLPYATIVEADNIRTIWLEDISTKLTEKQIEEIGPIDIVLVPIAKGVEAAKQLDPWVIIPSSYDPTAVLKELGVGELNPVAKYVISSDKLPSELQIVVLEDKSHK